MPSIYIEPCLVPAQFIYLADSLYKEMLICQLLQLGMF
jgi:hypothetical protein